MRIHLIATICAALAGACVLSAPALAQKTEKQCQDEWRANRAANQAAKITEKDYVAKCKAGTTAAEPATPSAQPTATTPATPPPPAAKSATPAPKTAPTPKAPPPAATAATSVGEFTTEASAKASCPGDLVVWANLDSKIYHFSTHKDYGHTKEGAYMCEKVALGQGIRAAKNERHP